ncbi:TonB-dependent receptor [Roseivirga sp.]|uniref:TonB-dependent receptor n=1 Tax=Roseivirga sp. TaxID=1964215 RepID=UPI003B8CA58A
MRFYCLSLFFSFCFCSTLKSQVLTGKVLNVKKQPIAGATVLFHRTERHTHSNVFGEFELEEIVKGDTIVISSIGYKGKTVVVQDLQNDLTIFLEEEVLELGDVVVTNEIDALNIFADIDMSTTPVKSSQEVLQKIPGLIIGQHAGGGKAEQIFLRGFDIDHGTDINITVDGLPVNMVSHAHGQGYADLHFLIPETIDKIDFGKGPYYANQGNFNTAGYAAFKTKDRLDQSSIRTEVGSFNALRTLGMFNILNTERQSAYVAADMQLTDGPFISSQNFRRINLMAKYTNRLANDDVVSLSVSRFVSEWDASGQIPVRLVESGVLDRFGAVDDTEGGNTSRTNIKFDYTKRIDRKTYLKSEVYFSQYDFELFSNFTFFLEDPINGDQIRQRESRQIIGASSEWNKFVNNDLLIKAGVGFRNDRAQDVGLSRTLNRSTTLEDIQLGDIDETNTFTYLSAELELGKWMINPALRYDFFDFKYNDKTATLYNTLAEAKGIFSPKINILYNQSESLQYYFKTGVGFHSNDTRVVVTRQGNSVLPAAFGNDLGAIWKPSGKLIINAALWSLFLEQEFVYVGDAGIVEPSGRTHRTGVDFSLRYQASSNLFLYGDVNLARARSRDEPEGADRIPLAPEFTATGGIDLVDYNNFSGGVRVRFVDDRPANEDNSIVAEGYFITDFNLNYSVGNVVFGFAIENLFDSEWKETQFATESRLFNETQSVEEIHFTPGTPFAIRGGVTFKF